MPKAKYTRAQKALLFEAYRRNDMALQRPTEAKLPLTLRWLGLGTRSAYRSVLDANLMVFHNGKNPPVRCMGWLVLTEEGVRALAELTPEFEAALKALKQDKSYQRSFISQYVLAGGILS